MKRLVVCIAVASALVAGCGKKASTKAASPRIITFAPNLTNIAFQMGVGDHVVGVTTYCKPPAGQSRTIIGDAERFNSEAILSEKPDLIFHDHSGERLDAFGQRYADVKLIRIRTRSVDELRQGILTMGEKLGRKDLAEAMVAKIDAQVAAVAKAVEGRPRPRVLFVMGSDKAGTLGQKTMMTDLIRLAGGRNVAVEAGIGAYGQLNRDAVRELKPDVLICQTGDSDEQVKDAREFWESLEGVPAVDNRRVYVTGNQNLTLYDGLIGEVVRELAGMIHPDAFSPETAP